MYGIHHHKYYTLTNDRFTSIYDHGEIRSVKVEFHKHDVKVGDRVVSEFDDNASVTVEYINGQLYLWTTQLIDSYTFQFGVAVSHDGQYLFAQTWERGLYCLDPKSGKTIWRTKSKRGITNIFVNKDTLLVHQHERALQLLDIHTGEVLLEKRPATAWGFTSLNHDSIICQSTARVWEIIDTETLEVLESFSHKAFTDGHTDYVVNHIELQADNSLLISGFTNVWDDTQKPPKMLPNKTFTNMLKVEHAKLLGPYTSLEIGRHNEKEELP